jgi:hypothetical protein
MAEPQPRSLPPNTFLAEVTIGVRNPDGRMDLGVDGKPKNTRVIGNFVFRAPTLRERIDIGVARTKFLQGLNPTTVGGDTLYYAEALAALPVVTIDAPEGWKTAAEIGAQCNEEEVQVVYRAYVDGLDKFLSATR